MEHLSASLEDRARKFVNQFAMTVRPDEVITVAVTGDWSIRHGLPSLAAIRKVFAPGAKLREMTIDAANLDKWDSALLAFLYSVERLCREHGVQFDLGTLPPGVHRLIRLSRDNPGRAGDPPAKSRRSLLARIGEAVLREGRAVTRFVGFLGDSVLALLRFLRGRARYRPTDLFVTIQECGAQAFPIVSVISLLVGMIFAFVGAVQLKQFGADIYDANLVAVAMAREMAAVMTGIVLAGRTGAAFAAQIGAMQGNEEIDALTTLGISPIDFLVLPRMIALVLMTPLLCIYANAMGLLGGFLVAINILDVSPVAYLLRTEEAFTLGDFGIGIAKATVFGALVAITGCLRGIESGRNAAAVGAAATSAVVSGILAIIVTDAIFAVLLNAVGL
jgi:phospholipid/cholesterol/gamma-HCH transport system permease protein